MTKYAKCSECGYVIAIPDDKNSSDYVCPNDGDTLTDATEDEFTAHLGAYAYIVEKVDSGGYRVVDREGSVLFIETDSTHAENAIQHAIDSLPGGGGLVMLSEGKFYVSSPILINKSIVFKGSGGIGAPGYPDFGGTLLYLVNNSNCDVIQVNDPSNYFYFVVLEQFQIWGNISHNTSGGGIYVGSHSSDVLIHDVVVRATPGTGITMRPDHNGWIDTVWVEDCRDGGIYGRTNNIWITNSCIGGNQPNNIYLKQYRDARIIGNSIWNGNPNGVYIEDFSYCKIIGNWFNSNWKNLRLISAFYSVVSGNTFKSNNEYAIEVKGSTYNTIVGNTFENNCCLSGPVIVKVSRNNSTYSNYNIFKGNIVLETTEKAEYGIGETEAGHDYWIITDNIFTGMTTAAINMQGSHNIIRHNQGYTTENSGTATIPNGNSSVTVNHGLVKAPEHVFLTGTHTEVANCWVTNKTDTQFTINAPANVTADRDVYWEAEV